MRSSVLLVVGLTVMVLFVASCQSSTTAQVTVPDGCNPIGAGAMENDCLLPYPSDVFRTSSGVVIPPAAQVAFQGAPVDFTSVHPHDGFPIGSPILALFPQGVDDKNLVFWKTGVERSREASSPTVLLDAETGERVLHFAEVDPRTTDPTRQALVIRPMVRLENGHRYIVAIHDLVDKAGHAVTPPAGFASLRDNKGAGNPKLAALSPHFENDIFPIIAKAGIDRSTLQLAWDFTTVTEDDMTRDMLDIRSDVISRLSAAAPEVEVVSVETNTGPQVAKRIHAQVTVPLYLDTDQPGGVLQYDANGRVTAKATTKVPFTIWIPPSVANRPPGSPQARLLQFGHGFFGDQTEVDCCVVQIAEEKGFVVFAADWWGLSKPDEDYIANEIFKDPAHVASFVDRLEQAMANFMYVAAAMKGGFAGDPNLLVNGQPAYDPRHLYYYGNSLGGILGNVYLSQSPFVERAGASVCAADWGLMLFRSRAFLPLLAVISAGQDDPLELQKLGAFLQAPLERVDGLTYAPHLLSNRYPMNPPTLDIVMQIGLSDGVVPNIASFYLARILGIPVMDPSPLPASQPFGLTHVASPTLGSAMTLFDFGVPGDDLAESSLDDNHVHDLVHAQEATRVEMDGFFHPGAPITHPCSGACKGQ